MARRRTWRGSPSYGVRSGVWMSQNIRATPASLGRQGSIANVVGSGIAIMSDSSIGVEARDRRAVEAHSTLERVGQLGRVDREGLQLTEDVGEPQPDEADLALLGERHHVICGQRAGDGAHRARTSPATPDPGAGRMLAQGEAATDHPGCRLVLTACGSSSADSIFSRRRGARGAAREVQTLS